MYQNIKFLEGKKIILRDPEVGRFIGSITYADESSNTERDLFGDYKYKAMLDLSETTNARIDDINPYVVLFKDEDDIESFMKGNSVSILFYWYINLNGEVRTANSTGSIKLR